jgi:hypothetical protein
MDMKIRASFFTVMIVFLMGWVTFNSYAQLLDGKREGFAFGDGVAYFVEAKQQYNTLV